MFNDNSNIHSELHQVLPDKNHTRKRQTTQKGGTQSHWPTSGVSRIWLQGCRVDTVLLTRTASHTERGDSHVGILFFKEV
jgi:hypothetical protein